MLVNILDRTKFQKLFWHGPQSLHRCFGQDQMFCKRDGVFYWHFPLCVSLIEVRLFVPKFFISDPHTRSLICSITALLAPHTVDQSWPDAGSMLEFPFSYLYVSYKVVHPSKDSYSLRCWMLGPQVCPCRMLHCDKRNPVHLIQAWASTAYSDYWNLLQYLAQPLAHGRHSIIGSHYYQCDYWL